MNAIDTIALWFANDAGLYARAQQIAEDSDTLEEAAEAFENEVDDMVEDALESSPGFVKDIVTNAVSRITYADWRGLASIYMEEAGKLTEEEQEELNEGD